MASMAGVKPEAAMTWLALCDFEFEDSLESSCGWSRYWMPLHHCLLRLFELLIDGIHG